MSFSSITKIIDVFLKVSASKHFLVETITSMLRIIFLKVYLQNHSVVIYLGEIKVIVGISDGKEKEAAG